MGKAAKGSRKGKKAWRTNIKTDDIDEYFEKATKDAHSGVSSTITSLPSESLFYLDKSTDVPVKRKIEKHRQKVLRHESLLQSNPFVQPVPSSILKKRKVKKELKKINNEIGDVLKTQDLTSQHDIWNNKGEQNVKTKKKLITSIIPAVEVEPPGCSFNPPFEAHQDSLAEAVADEMLKIYREELGPQPVPLIVPGEIIEEEERYFLDAGDGDESSGEEQGNANELLAQRKSKTKRVTRVEFNRRAKRKKQLKAEAESKKKEYMSKQIDCLADIVKEIAKEDNEKDGRHLRRAIAKHESLKVRPPRLGKNKFVPAPKQVLLTEEISGSIRKLKGCCTLARDRFKSLEKRGLLVPRAKGQRQRRR